MTSKKPTPLVSGNKHEKCPICGERSYSRTGIHPQCSRRQFDEKRVSRIKREQAEKADLPANSKPWQRICPQCKTSQHVRMKSCECGHQFSIASAATSSTH